MAKSKEKEEYSHSDSGIGGQYKTWFLDYASCVILERAVPAVEDGFETCSAPYPSRHERDGRRTVQ